MRRLNVGYFRANKAVGDQIREKLLEFAAQPRPLNDSRTANLDEETTVLLRNISVEAGGTFLLDFTKLRNVAALPLSDRSGNEDRVTFDGPLRPAEYMAAMFDPESRVLVIHETTPGVSHTGIGKYWPLMEPQLPKFRFDPILEQRAADLLLTAGAFSKFSVSLAHMGTTEQMRSMGLTDDEIIDLIKTYSSPNISITLSIDPQSRRTLAVEKIKSLANALLRWTPLSRPFFALHLLMFDGSC